MKLENLLEGLSCNLVYGSKAISNPPIDDIVYDSRKAAPNTVFVAIPGETVNGHKFIGSAYDNGCRVFVVSEDTDVPEDSTKIQVKDSRKALSKISATFFGNPTKKLTITGITGTKGKTTTTTLLRNVVAKGNRKTGVIGTNGIFFNDKTIPTKNTTPESYELQKTFKTMLDDGVDTVFMEVSSSGLMMNRVNDIDFDIAVFTNISPDHIGPKEHATFEDYMECKTRLFKMTKTAIINSDDPKAPTFIKVAEESGAKIITYGFQGTPTYLATDIDYSASFSHLESHFTLIDTLINESIRYISPNPGEFSVYNCLSVIAVARELGMKHDEITEAMKTASVPGRVEVINRVPGAHIILDYAHNGVSLENILKTMKLYNPKRLICLFGSIGGRAFIRRKDMANVTIKYADITIITTDNPDNEDPEAILDDLQSYYTDYKGQLFREVDRETAIHMAVNMLQPGDILVVAGKGHENYQIINGKKVPFDERGIILEAAEEKASSMENAQ